ncbi:hypothetical protein EZV62_003977 [Acer yangbiense]|uniref:Reverse transcriptase n=1 Tax=Acer yangbiense TaxID=1000413 RepID=A0A5C7IKC8_9ROSI|nr:hypothetical protein EZV62_003977 [Acer yangbiense]
MASDTEVATRVEEQGRGREEQHTQTKRGKSKGPSMDALESRMVGLEEAISGMQTTLGDTVDRLDGLETDYDEITQATKSTIRKSQKGFKEDVCFLTQEFHNFRTFVEHELRALRMEVEDVRTYGTRNAMEVENFLFGLEQYFEAKGARDNATKIANAPTFLRDAAQLWWRRKHGDTGKGINPIHTWEDFKKELKRQLCPTNAEKEARGRLRRLKQTGSIRDYVKEFTTLSLEIEDMSEKDSLFYFMDGLKDWARVELERRNVQDLNAAIAEAESLTDYSTQSKEKKSNQGKSGGDKSGQRSQGRKEEGQQKPSNTDKRNKPSGESQDGGYEADMGSLRQLGALKGNNTPSTSTKKGLMFINASINGKAVRAMLDTGATHNFVSIDEAKKLGLKATSGGGTIKASPAKPIAGIAKAVPVCLGAWSGKLDFSIVPMDDFQVVLGMEFFDQVHAPAGNSLSILDGSKTCMVTAERIAKVESKALSALQFKRGMKTDPSFLTTLRELNDGEDPLVPKDPMPTKVQAVLDEYKDVMPQELPKKLPPKREVDHQIELEPGKGGPRLGAFLQSARIEILHGADFAIGGVLMQNGHPIVFESRKLSDTERRYTVQEKEMTAIIHYLRVWRHYLLGATFLIMTDNVTTSYFQTQKKLSPEQARWQDFLAEFDYRLKYKPGKANVVADALSRKAELAIINTSQPQSTLISCIKEGLQQDPLAKSLIKLANEGKTRRFWLDEGILLTTGDRMFVPKWGNLRKEIIKECHDSKWAGHPGMTRTLALLQNSYYWPQMRDDVDAYVRTYLVCQQDKVEQQRLADLLEPLPIAGRPWESVLMDFISALSKSKGCGSIMMVVDRFSKYGTFIPATKNCTAEEAARLFLKHVVKLWGVPQNIVSDHDPRFTRRFWTELFKMLGTDLNFSTSFHPQSDGKTKSFNELLELYLRHYVSAHQRDWAKLLDMAQFSFNLQRSEATSKSPFEIVMGQQPMTPNAIASTYGGKSPAAHKLTREWHEQGDITRACLDKAARKMQKWADTRRRHLEFNEGDLVLIKLLPQQFKSLRQVHKGHGGSESKRAPTAVVTTFDKDVECVLADRVIRRRGVPNYIEYLVKWKELSDSKASWERRDTLWQFAEHIQRYKDEDTTRTPRA